MCVEREPGHVDWRWRERREKRGLEKFYYPLEK